MKKTTVVAILSVLVMVLVVGCSVGMMLVGTSWTDESGIKYTFKEDGVFTMSVGAISTSGEYTSDQDELTLTFSALGVSASTVYTVKINGDTMTWTNGNSTTTLTRNK